MAVPLHYSIDLLRFNTCGSVADGKSTLIGRLLYDSKSLMEDQLEALERSADITGGGQINLANLTHGLRAEREQGITIDVAYRYFATPRRKFIIADTPGHIQYTRNMVTGASSANLSIILVDARHGVIVRTRQKVTALPAGIATPVEQIWTYDGPVDEAFCPQSVTIVLDHDIDISRGSMLIGTDHLPGATTQLQAEICWMHPRALQPGRKYFLKHTTHTVQVAVTEIVNKLNMATLETETEPAELAMNDIGEICLRAAKPL